MEYRLNRNQLLEIMEEWNRFLRRKVHLIACGGTAMTLLGVKSSTKDVDFMAPNISEYKYQVFEKLVVFTVIMIPIYAMFPHISC